MQVPDLPQFRTLKIPPGAAWNQELFFPLKPQLIASSTNTNPVVLTLQDPQGNGFHPSTYQSNDIVVVAGHDNPGANGYWAAASPAGNQVTLTGSIGSYVGTAKGLIGNVLDTTGGTMLVILMAKDSDNYVQVGFTNANPKPASPLLQEFLYDEVTVWGSLTPATTVLGINPLHFTLGLTQQQVSQLVQKFWDGQVWFIDASQNATLVYRLRVERGI